MPKPQKDSEERKEFVKQYEAMLLNNEFHFFDLNAYEEIIDFYGENAFFEDALKACNHALEQYPYAYELKVSKAQIVANLGNTDEAFSLLESAEIYEPNNEEIVFVRAIVTAQIGLYQESINLFNSIEETYYEKDNLLFQKGITFQMWGKFDLAVDCYKKVIDINASHEEALYELAFCLDMTDKLEDSVAYYEEFIDQDPYSHAAWYNLGIIYNKLGKKIKFSIFACKTQTLLYEASILLCFKIQCFSSRLRCRR